MTEMDKKGREVSEGDLKLMAINKILRRRCVEEPKRSQASCISLAPLGIGLQDLDEEGGNGTSI